MSQISQVQINYNIAKRQAIGNIPSNAFIIGVAQRGPVYKPIPMSDVNSFLTVFGQPTSKYEFDFFQGVKSIIESGGVAICYRIPYYDKNKKLYDAKFEYYVTDASKINPSEDNLILQEYDGQSDSKNVYYQLFVGEKIDDGYGLYIQQTPTTSTRFYYVLKLQNNTYYKLHIWNSRMYITETNDSADIAIAKDYLTLKFGDNPPVEFHLNLQLKEDNSIGLFLEQVSQTRAVKLLSKAPNDDQIEETETIIFDTIYKQKGKDEWFPSTLPGAKLTFTPINDFNSALRFSETVSLTSDCYTLKNDIDPSHILGVFPLIFGPKDAENIRNITNLSSICYYDNGVLNNLQFEAYTCDEDNTTYIIGNESLQNDFNEFIKATHFKPDWIKIEIEKLIDRYIPQDIENAKNTIGVAFIAYYLDDEHKLDYTILESFYGILNGSNSNFSNIEDLINRYSCFFNLEIEGEIEKDIYVEALNVSANTLSRNTSWTIPFIAPYPPNEDIEHDILMDDIFAKEPENKFDKKLSKSLSNLYDKLQNTEFTNSSPFDYILAPGLQDIMLTEISANDIQEGYLSMSDGIVPYTSYIVDLDILEPENWKEDLFEISLVQRGNTRSLYRMLGMFTSLGDKGTIALIDVPEKFNKYFIENIESCYGNENSIKELLSRMSTPKTSRGQNPLDVFPNLFGTREIYDRTYPLFNYQKVDIDKKLTRYKKFRKHRKFETVPASAMVVGAYIGADTAMDYAPIAGPRSSDWFTDCHASLMETNPKFFKLLYDLYGISSLMNNKDNETFPVQQTTWRNTNSVLKQIHAFRIYISIRRAIYNIAKSYLYEPHTEQNVSDLKRQLNSLLNWYKEHSYIDSISYADAWADISDIEQNQVQVEINIGIFGAIVKIIVNLNLTDMKIEIV